MKIQFLSKSSLYLLLAIALMAISCDTAPKETPSAETPAASAEAQSLPYVASYSSNFEMGKPEYVATILQGSWKDWETNNLDNMKSWVADTIVAYHSNYQTVAGVDSLQASWKRARAKYSSVIDTIQAVMPVHSADKDENWVLVWAKEINTHVDGKVDTSYLMETWRINKDGKADLLLQYDRERPKN